MPLAIGLGLSLVHGGGVSQDTELSPPLTDLIAWFRADLGVTDAGSGKVSSWDDQANAFDLSQGSAGNRPTVVSDVINGHSVIRFERDNSEFIDRALTPALSQPFTVTAIVAAVAGNADAGLFDDGAGGNFRQVILEENGATAWRVSLFAGAGLNGGVGSNVAGGTFAWLELVFNGASSEIRVNNVQAVTGDAGSGSLTGIRLGRRHDDSLPIDGDIAELMVHNSVLDAGERTEMAAYILDRYGIS
jgi:hypothetical protein